LPITGFITIFFTRFRDTPSHVENAKVAGYEASEEEKRLDDISLREMAKLYLLLPLAYTIASILLEYLVVEPSGMLPVKAAVTLYFWVSWSQPLIVMAIFVIPIINDRRYPEVREFTRKSLEGLRLKRRMRELGVTDPRDPRSMREDESEKKKD
jgi:hypothetical protein